ncbi:HTH_Tnp_Tc3_2 domain-containing protein [Trichonephila clavipes]|nr:HTH_Tnp_Tc3_2 domain-containing protein [Trichonephila clavipes]
MWKAKAETDSHSKILNEKTWRTRVNERPLWRKLQRKGCLAGYDDGYSTVETVIFSDIRRHLEMLTLLYFVCIVSGRPRVTTTYEDRYLAVTAKRNRRSTASYLSRQLSSATGTTVSRQTVYRRLGHIGLYARRPVRRIPLTATHPVACF